MLFQVNLIFGTLVKNSARLMDTLQKEFYDQSTEPIVMQVDPIMTLLESIKTNPELQEKALAALLAKQG